MLRQDLWLMAVFIPKVILGGFKVFGIVLVSLRLVKGDE